MNFVFIDFFFCSVHNSFMSDDGYCFWHAIKKYIDKDCMTFDAKFDEFWIIERFCILQYLVTIEAAKIKSELKKGYLVDVEDNEDNDDDVELSDATSTSALPPPCNIPPPRRNPPRKRRRVM